MNRTIAALLLAGMLVSPLAAEQVYVRNKPFKGAVSGQGASTMVELQGLAQALGLKVESVNGGWVVNQGADMAGPGKVIVSGKEVQAQVQGESVLVNLKEFSEAVGARFVVNKSMGTIDVNMAVKPITEAPPPPPRPTREDKGPVALSPLAPIVVKQKTPGEKLDVNKWIKRDRTNIVYFHADW